MNSTTSSLGEQIAFMLIALPFLIIAILSLMVVLRYRREQRPQSKKVIACGLVAFSLWLLLSGAPLLGF